MPSMVREVSAIFVAMITLREPGGGGSKIFVCISLGNALYTGSIINSGDSGPRDFNLN